MTKPKPYKRYSAEFKKEAVRRASEEGTTDKPVCDELGISTRQFGRWRFELEVLGKDAFTGKGQCRDYRSLA
ncbi:MAG: transposase [Pseudomonadales bacterium]